MEINAELSRFSTPMTRPAVNARTWHRIGLAGILLLAVFLHFFRLEQEGYANLYYAAAVKSMLTSWRNFFFISFDPGGFVTVDKPPLGLWVQAASAALFGFSGFSLLLPQVLAGVLSVLVLYHLVRRVFGPTAGLLVALVLAVTPISVAANRNNTMDSQLVLLLLLAAWAAIRAAETGRLRWLLGCALLVGLGFNVKMLQAFLVLPAFVLLYLVASPVRWWKRLVHLGLAAVVLLVVSFAWVVAASRRPMIPRSFPRLLSTVLSNREGSRETRLVVRRGEMVSRDSRCHQEVGHPHRAVAAAFPTRSVSRACCASLITNWQGRSVGCCRWRSWDGWPLPGRRARVFPSTAVTRTCCCG